MPAVIRAPLRRRRREAGFTLIELLVAMAVLGILVAGFSTVLSSTIRHSDDVQELSTLQTEARAAIDRIAEDLRQAYTGEDGVSPIESISPTQITFLSPDRATPFHLRRVSYRLAGGRLERALATSSDTDGPPWSIPALGPWQPQVSRVVNTTLFQYYDASGAGTSVPASVRTVKVTLTVATAANPSRRTTYETRVSVRTWE